MVEVGLTMKLAIVDVDGREEQHLRVAARELEGHWVDVVGHVSTILRRGRTQLEYHESVISVCWHFAPHSFWQVESRIQSMPVGVRRDEGCIEAADPVHPE